MKWEGYLAGYEPPGERTRVMLEFSGVGAGVALYTSAEEVSGSPSGLKAVITRANADGDGPLEKLKPSGHIAISNRLPLAGVYCEAPKKTSN